MLPQVAWDVAVQLVAMWGGQLTSDHIDHLLCSACLPTLFMFCLVVHIGMFLGWLNGVLVPQNGTGY